MKHKLSDDALKALGQIAFDYIAARKEAHSARTRFSQMYGAAMDAVHDRLKTATFSAVPDSEIADVRQKTQQLYQHKKHAGDRRNKLLRKMSRTARKEYAKQQINSINQLQKQGHAK